MEEYLWYKQAGVQMGINKGQRGSLIFPSDRNVYN